MQWTRIQGLGKKGWWASWAGKGKKTELKECVSEMREEARCILCILLIAIGSTLGDMRKLTYLDQVLDYMEKYSCDNVTLKCGMISGKRFWIIKKKSLHITHQNKV